MSRVIPICFCFILFFCGCGKTAVAPKSNSFEMTAAIVYEGSEFEADIFASNADIFTVTFKSPEKISGLKFSWDTSSGSIEYKSLRYDFEPEQVPTLFKTLAAAFKTVFLEDSNVTANSNGTFTKTNGDISVVLNDKGVPIEIKSNYLIMSAVSFNE